MRTPLASSVLQGASALGMLFLLVLAAGSKPSTASTSDDASTSTTSSTSFFGDDPTEPKVSMSGAKVPNYEYIRATCENVKVEGECMEFYGLIPKFSPDSCAKEGGSFVLSTPKPRPCPKEKWIGTCHYVQSRAGEPGQYANYYANNRRGVAALKAECTPAIEGRKAEWIDAPSSSAAPSATAPASAAPKGAAGPKSGAPPKAPAKAKTK